MKHAGKTNTSEKPASGVLHDKPPIVLKNITIGFGAGNLISNFSLTLFPGQWIVITGKSGAGKSTLVRCILGFERPRRGSIYVCGTRLSQDTVWKLRRKIAYIPQDPDPGPGTLEQWLFRLFDFKANHGVRENTKKIPSIAARLGLAPDLLKKDTSRLSGGEKQRAAIMAALLLDREIILADEPTSALDRSMARTVVQYLRSLTGISGLIISHDRDLIESADLVVSIP